MMSRQLSESRRKKARAKSHQIFIRDKGRCRYCRRKVMLCRLLRHKNVSWYSESHDGLSFTINGKTRLLRKGTLDHIIPLRTNPVPNSGNLNAYENLALCCAECNENKERRDKKVTGGKDDIPKCQCGNQRKKNKQYCGSCEKLFEQQKLSEQITKAYFDAALYQGKVFVVYDDGVGKVGKPKAVFEDEQEATDYIKRNSHRFFRLTESTLFKRKSNARKQ